MKLCAVSNLYNICIAHEQNVKHWKECIIYLPIRCLTHWEILCLYNNVNSSILIYNISKNKVRIFIFSSWEILLSKITSFCRCSLTLGLEMKMLEELSSECLGKLFPKQSTTLWLWRQERWEPKVQQSAMMLNVFCGYCRWNKPYLYTFNILVHFPKPHTPPHPVNTLWISHLNLNCLV